MLVGFEQSMFPKSEEVHRKQRVNTITAELRQLEGLAETAPQIDRSGLNRMKAALSGEGGSRIKVKQ